MSQPCVSCGHNVFAHDFEAILYGGLPDGTLPCPECPDRLCHKGERPVKKPRLEDDPAFQLAWAVYRFPDGETLADRDAAEREALLEMRAIARRLRAAAA